MPITIEDVHVGQEISPLVKRPTEIALFRFSAVTWNSHRIHYNREYASSEGYPNILVQGHMHGAYLTQMLLDWIGPAGSLQRLQWSNRHPAYPGDTLACRGRVTRVREDDGSSLVDCEIWTENQNGDVCAPGMATVVLASGRDDLSGRRTT